MSPELAQAQTRLEAAAKTTANEIIADLANPNSLSDAYGLTTVGNKRGEIANNKVGTSFPEMFIDYDGNGRKVIMWSINQANPGAPQGKEVFNEITMAFNVTPGFNGLDRKLAEKQQLNAQDFQNLFATNLVGLNYASVLHPPMTENTLTMKSDGSFSQQVTRSGGAPTDVLIGETNYSQLDAMARDLQATEIGLREGLSYK